MCGDGRPSGSNAKGPCAESPRPKLQRRMAAEARQFMEGSEACQVLRTHVLCFINNYGRSQKKTFFHFSWNASPLDMAVTHVALCLHCMLGKRVSWACRWPQLGDGDEQSRGVGDVMA